jgi:hypothetical protein
MFLIGGCNTPSNAVNPNSTAAYIESRGYAEAVNKVKLSIETLGGLVAGERGDQAKFESMKLVELVNGLRSFDPMRGVDTSMDDLEYQSQVKDLYFASNQVWSHVNERHMGQALDAMGMLVARYNRLSSRFGPGDSVIQGWSTAATTASR